MLCRSKEVIKDNSTKTQNSIILFWLLEKKFITPVIPSKKKKFKGAQPQFFQDMRTQKNNSDVNYSSQNKQGL